MASIKSAAIILFLSVLWGLQVLAGESYSLIPDEPTSEVEMSRFNKINAIIGTGYNMATGVPKPGVTVYTLNTSAESSSGGGRSRAGSLKIAGGVEIFGTDVELSCLTPWIVDREIDENGNTNRDLGIESISCGAKVQFYNNAQNGNSASIKVSIHDLNSNPRIVVPLTFLKLFDDGNTAVIGSVTVDQALGGGSTKVTSAVGAGVRLDAHQSVSADLAQTNTRNRGLDLVYGYKATNNILFWVKVWRARSGVTGETSNGALFGVEITDRRTESTPFLFR